MKDFAVVVNDCAAPPVPGILAVRGRTTDYGDRNFTLKIDELVDGLPAILTDLQMDWMEILGYLFAADLACVRGAGDVEWARSVDLWLPVRDPGFWETRRPLLEQIWMDLTGDTLRIHLEQDMDPAPPPRTGKEYLPHHDCVALLSGGQDSLVGALDLISQGRRPLFISHSASGAVNVAQNAIELGLREHDDSLVRLKLGAHRTPGSTFRETSLLSGVERFCLWAPHRWWLPSVARAKFFLMKTALWLFTFR